MPLVTAITANAISIANAPLPISKLKTVRESFVMCVLVLSCH